jgi:hypothetical protein
MTTNNTNIGYHNTGDWNSGHLNTGNGNTGNYNTGSCNVGDYNIGNRNIGYWNLGNDNIGNRNTGHLNIGRWNSGDWNSGDWNSGDWNSGYCNSITGEDCFIFNKVAKRQDWENAKIPDWMCVDLIKWVSASDMTEKEKEAYPSYITTGGYLKTYPSLTHAYIEAWENTTQEDRELTKQLPNFPLELEEDGTDVFKEVFGFPNPFIKSKKETIQIGGDTYELTDDFLEELKKLKKVDKN